MRTTLLLSTAWLGAAIIAHAAAAPGSAAPPAPEQRKPAKAIAPAADRAKPTPPELVGRLSALDPARPRGYFELAEEFGDLPGDAPRTQAREALVVCASLAAASDDAPLFRSALLELAALADSPAERRWIRAVMDVRLSTMSGAPLPKPAGQAKPGKQVLPTAPKRAAPAPSVAAAQDASYDLAVALGRYRAGEFRRARESLRRVGDPQERMVEAGMEPERAKSILAQVTSESEGLPGCPQCHNERVVRRVVDGRQVIEPCPTCFANPGPTPPLQPDAFLEQLRAEALLLDVPPRSWGDESLLDAGRPLRDVSFQALCEQYRVDPSRSVWRDGRWARP